MIRGTISGSTTDPGLDVTIDIRGSQVRIRCGPDTWSQPASRVAIDTLNPETYQLVFGDEVFILRPNDPLQVRLQLMRELETASRRRRWRRGRHPVQPQSLNRQTDTNRVRWIRDDVEVEAVLPEPEPDASGLAWFPTRGRREVSAHQ